MFYPPNRSKISDLTSSSPNTCILRKIMACKLLINNNFPKNLCIRVICTIKMRYLKFNLAESIIIVVYLTSAKTTHTSTISAYPSAMVSVLFVLFSISNIFILPIITLFVGLPMELIKTPQKSSETLVNIADRCLQARKLGVGGNLRSLQLSNLFIRHLHIIIKSLCVPLHLPFKML
jgi:hypothetical protein